MYLFLNIFYYCPSSKQQYWVIFLLLRYFISNAFNNQLLHKNTFEVTCTLILSIYLHKVVALIYILRITDIQHLVYRQNLILQMNDNSTSTVGDHFSSVHSVKLKKLLNKLCKIRSNSLAKHWTGF